MPSVQEYYDQTRYDYRVAWDDSEHPAVHFGFYDENADNHTSALMNTNQVLANAADVKKVEQVLDAGCGKGGSCFWLAEHLEAIATGITPVATQIEDCLKQQKTLGLEDKTHFLQADYCDTPFEDASFDVVWACESLCHAVDKAAFYQEAFRVLKPGGRLIVAEYIRSQRPHPAAGERLLAEWLNPWAIQDIDTEAEHLGYMQKVGFESINIKNVTSQTRTSLRNLHRNSTNWLWFSHILKFVRIRSKIAHGNMVASIRQYEALEKKLWFYALISATKPV